MSRSPKCPVQCVSYVSRQYLVSVLRKDAVLRPVHGQLSSQGICQQLLVEARGSGCRRSCRTEVLVVWIRLEAVNHVALPFPNCLSCTCLTSPSAYGNSSTEDMPLST
jgi:hypothetical protein